MKKMAGRPRKPTLLKKIQGTHRPCRENPEEPMLPAEVPITPDHLNDYARKEWEEISIILYNQGILSIIDKAALAGYCVMYGRWVEAEKKVEEEPFVTENVVGQLITNPYIKIANEAYKLMAKALTEFGMTPASRPKISVKKDKNENDPWAQFAIAPKEIE